MNYANITSLMKVKNKPNQSQLKPKQTQFLYLWQRSLFIMIAPLLAFAGKQGGEFDKEFCTWV